MFEMNKYGLLTKREIKMAGYWPSAVFYIFMDRASLVNKGFVICEKTLKNDLYTCGRKPLSQAGKIAPSCPLG